MEQKSTQDYLKAIYNLAKNGDLVSTTEICTKTRRRTRQRHGNAQKTLRRRLHKILTLPRQHPHRKRTPRSPKSNPQTPPPRNIPLRRPTHRKRQSPHRSLPNGARPLRRSRRIALPPTETSRHLLRRRQNHPSLRFALLEL